MSGGGLDESEVKKRQNKLNKDKDSNGGLESMTPSTLWCIFLQKRVHNQISIPRQMQGSLVLRVYSLRHYSQSRKWGLYDSVRCSELHTDFLPELFLVKGANSDPGVFFTFGTNMPEHKGYTPSWPVSVFLSRMSCTGASPPQQRGGWCFLSV